MIRIEIDNIGPHEATRLVVPDLADIEGDSEAGKTHLVHALALAICGVDAHGRKWDSRRRRDEGASARVKIAAPGLNVERKLGKRPGSVQLHGVGRLTSQVALEEALHMTGRRDLVLSIIAPGYWQRLLDTPKARGMRDMLATVLPQVDTREIVAEIMQAHGGLQDSDPLVLGSATRRETALHLQRETNNESLRLEGMLDGYREAHRTIEASEPVEPDAALVAAAERRVQLEKQVAAHNAYIRADAQNRIDREDHARLVKAWEGRRDAAAARHAAVVKSWQARLAAMGDEPAAPGYEPPDIGEHAQRVKAADDQVEQLVAKLDELDAAEAAAEALVESSTADARAAARAERATLDAMLTAGTCPTCGHEVSEAELQAQRELADKAAREHDDAIATARQQYAEAVAIFEANEKTTGDEMRTARAMLASAQKRRDIAQQSADRHAAAVQAAEQWRRSRAALGDEPADPGFAEPRPELKLRSVTPTRAPNLDGLPTLEEARATLQARDGHVKRHADWSTGLVAQADRVLATEEKVRALSLECDRVAALVQAVRDAPTVAARRQVAALHDAMRDDRVHVHIAGTDEAGDLVRVERDGRPWWMSSNGAQAMLDLVLRDGLRRLAIDLPGLGWLASLPVVVDNAQDWSGDWPLDSWSGPVWWLTTTGGVPDLTVYDATEA